MSLRRVAQREWLALAAVLVVAGVLRLAAPGADLPWTLERTNAPIQDAFWYLEAAAGPIDGSSPEPMRAYDLPVWSSVARTWFRLWGASLASAHALSAVLALVALLLFWRIARAGLGPVVALAATAILAVLYPAVGMGRTSLIYGPALVPLLVAVMLWLSARGRPLLYRLLLEGGAWAIVIGATVVARPPLAALGGGLLLALAVRSPAARRPILVVGVMGGLALALFLLDTRIVLEPLTALQQRGGALAETATRLLRYLPRRLDLSELLARALEWGSEPGRATSLHGREATTTRGTGAFALAPVIFSVAAVGLGWALVDGLRRPTGRASGQETLALFAGWGAALIGGSLLLDHRPLRYFALLWPAVAILAGYAVARLWLVGFPPLRLSATRLARAAPDRAAPSWTTIAVASGIGALLLPHVADLVGLVPGRAGLDAAYRNWRTDPTNATFGLALAQAQTVRDQALFAAGGFGLLAGALAAWYGRLLPPVGPRLGLLILGLTVLPAAARSGALVARPTWSAANANRLTPDLVDASGKVAGPSASFLCLGAPRQRLRGSWLMTGDRVIERTLRFLDDRSVTHIALDQVQAQSARLTTQFAKHGRALSLVAVLPVQRPGAPHVSRVLLYRIAGAEARGYRCTPYEERRKADRADAPLEPGQREVDPGLRQVRVWTLLSEGALDRARAVAKN